MSKRKSSQPHFNRSEVAKILNVSEAMSSRVGSNVRR